MGSMWSAPVMCAHIIREITSSIPGCHLVRHFISLVEVLNGRQAGAHQEHIMSRTNFANTPSLSHRSTLENVVAEGVARYVGHVAAPTDTAGGKQATLVGKRRRLDQQLAMGY